ncbi:NAD-dependent epimerase/dehydratase family protein [Gemmatimonadota bacterium]
MTERVFVTGAAGFIGGHACKALLDNGYDVIGIDNFDPFYDRSIKEEVVRLLVKHPRFTLVEGDIRDSSVVSQAIEGADVVFHLAAKAGVRPSIEEPALYASVNVEGTVSLLEACRLSNVRRFVFGSSSSVYGDDTPVPFSEDAVATSPVSPYAATKRAGELMCMVFSDLYDMRIASLRFFTVYGHRQRPDLAIHRFTRLLAGGSSIQQFGDGSTERDYTHIDDILKGVLAAISWTEPDEPMHDVFNLGESRTVRLDELISLIAEALGVKPSIEMLPMQPGDVQRTSADISKAKRVLGYDPCVAIEDGIVDFTNWYRTKNGH